MKQIGWSIWNLVTFMYLIISSIFFSSNLYQTPKNIEVMPAPWAFSIWGLIYSLLFIYIVCSFFASPFLSKVTQSIGPWLGFSMIFSGTAVTVPAKYSLIFIVLSLLTLCIVYTKLSSLNASLLYRTPFTIYLAWTSIATIVDTFVVFDLWGIQELAGLDQLPWAVITLLIGAIVAITFTLVHRDFLFSLVFIWGYGAIYVFQDSTQIQWTTTASVIALLVTIIYTAFKKNQR